MQLKQYQFASRVLSTSLVAVRRSPAQMLGAQFQGHTNEIAEEFLASSRGEFRDPMILTACGRCPVVAQLLASRSSLHVESDNSH